MPDALQRSGPRTGKYGTWLALALVVGAAVAVRLLFLSSATAAPGFEWIDPDGYLEKARLLAGGWSLEGVRYQDFFKAPLYASFLSVFAHSSAFPWNAAVAQAVLDSLIAALMYALARSLGGHRLALAAAVVYAVFFPAITALSAFMQERLYVPVLLAGLTLLTHALRSRASPRLFAVAGLTLGVAALARSMPIYFVVPAAGWILWQDPTRHRWHAVSLLAGFAAATVPYVIFISMQAGHLVLIENIGSYGLARLTPEGRAYFPDDAIPTMGSTATFLWAQFQADPIGFVVREARYVVGMFHVPAGGWLQSHALAETARQAIALKTVAHILGDGIFIALALLAPIGLLKAPRPVAGTLGLWIVIHVVLTTVSGYSGLRFREPLNALLLALGLVSVLVSSQPMLRRRRVAAGLLILPIAAGIVVSAPTSLATRVPYGATSDRPAGTRSFAREAGFTIPIAGGIGLLEIARTTPGVATVEVWVDGARIQTLTIDDSPTRFRFRSAHRTAFIELVAGQPAGDVSPIVVRTGQAR